MGCWNETCGISGQSINEGEKVTAVFILLNARAGRSYEANGIAFPISFPIEGEYDDYGSVQNPVMGYAVESTLKLFNFWLENDKLELHRDFYEDVERQSSGRKLEFNEEDGFLTIETLFYAVERGFASLESFESFQNQKVPRDIAFMMVRQDVLDTAFESVYSSDDFDFRNTSTDKYSIDIQHMIDTCVNKIDKQSPDELINTISDKMDEIKDIPDSEEMMKKLQTELSKVFRDMHQSEYPWGGDHCKSLIEGRHTNVCYRLGRYEHVDTDAFRHLFKITTEMYTPEINDDLKKTILNFVSIMDVFMLFRKSWIPQAHASQHDNFTNSIEFMERMLTKMYARRIEMYEDGWYEDTPKEVIYNHPVFKNG